MYQEEKEDNTIYNVVLNHEEQYSIWPDYKEIPLGWTTVGKSGLKQDCLDYVGQVWTDMRPLSLRIKMEEMERRRPELEREHQKKIEELRKKPKDPRDDLVNFLSEGKHPVEAGLRPAPTRNPSIRENHPSLKSFSGEPICLTIFPLSTARWCSAKTTRIARIKKSSGNRALSVGTPTRYGPTSPYPRPTPA